MKLHNCYFTRDRSCWDAVVAMRVGLSGAIYLRSDLRQRYEDLSSLKSLSEPRRESFLWLQKE